MLSFLLLFLLLLLFLPFVVLPAAAAAAVNSSDITSVALLSWRKSFWNTRSYDCQKQKKQKESKRNLSQNYHFKFLKNVCTLKFCWIVKRRTYLKKRKSEIFLNSNSFLQTFVYWKCFNSVKRNSKFTVFKTILEYLLWRWRQ